MPTGFARPTRSSRVSASFDDHRNRKPPSANPGTDYPVPAGTPVFAVKDGIVAARGYSKLVGWWVVIYYDDGGSGDSLHNLQILVSEGQRVYRDQTQLAWSGNTGTASTGAHCHQSVRTGRTTALSNVGNFDLEKSLGGTAGGGATPITTLTEDDDMTTDFIYYVTSDSTTDPTIKKGSMFYQECVGAPLFPLQAPGKVYTDDVGQFEYGAFLNRHWARSNAYSGAYEDARVSILGNNMAALIKSRGLTSKPTGNFAPDLTGDVHVSTDNTALVAAVEANTAVQKQVLAAVKKLNPPD